MTNDDKARLLDLLVGMMEKSNTKRDDLFVARIAIENSNKIVCGFNTDIDMTEADDWIKAWFDETENGTKDFLSEQTAKLSHLLTEHGYADEATAVETNVAPNSEIIARRQKEAKKK